MRHLVRGAVFALAAMAALIAFAVPARAADADLSLAVKAPPVPFLIHGKRALGYELFIKAPCDRTIEITGVDVLSAAKGGALLSHMEGEDLAKHLRTPDRTVDGFVVFLWAELAKDAPIPEMLTHRVRYREGGEVKTIEGGEVKVASGKVVRIDPPLAGSGWVAANGPGNDDRHHRVSVLSVNGTPFISQRFAVDWIQLGSDGRIFKNKGKRNADWPGYGAELLAVADGVVADVRDGIPENKPLTVVRAVPMTLETLGGNYVVLEIGTKRYAFYAHLIPGSVRVKIGDRVKRGQVLGLLGNSGNSDAPHLHFHVCDGMDFLFSEGIPYELSAFALEGRPEHEDALATKKGIWKPAAPATPVAGELMGKDDIVDFVP